MTTLIIGQNSNLSGALLTSRVATHALSSRELTNNIALLDAYTTQPLNLIFNNFQTAVSLNDGAHLSEYIENSIHITAKILDYLRGTPIRKIIYTSSSSVYGNNVLCSERDELKPISLHAALKVSNEKLIEKYAQDRGIDYTIARIFNMYGGNDTFSIVGKIITSHLHNQELTIINNGNAIRDFVHIDTVVEVYQRLLDAKNLPIINIGSARGTSVRNLLDFLKNHGFHLQTRNLTRDELKISTADNTIMADLLGKTEYSDVESYLLSRLSCS
ncbi:NAD-dependent epimerase/dehydratase [Sulfuricurvum kujiense DSM 16994]|uniref:NAD-dependent epimerase/dehydratase n=1 Tax=Sulfuricurvum kujiense (strain ATCC BAA-921 / DSM 16994 / JCM 11577 / YK-1) TaxID=709032 RepID=E4TYC3_SULKY|nr:NAD(P)-dependent oxidoreductase [Sulfuricurvum kujiense]ADR35068.1 NAD-dependent epimerase/dehydratase [Sulfuricurvum kujiense DSM 16994]